MKKKIFSLVLAGALASSMAAVAMVSTSAATDSNGRYVPSAGTETKRYYFYMPDSINLYDEEGNETGTAEWKNKYAQEETCGVYWWGGTDACGSVDGASEGAAWPGYKAQYAGTVTDSTGLFEDEDGEIYDGDYTGSVYYIDCPADVSTIIWNNYVNGGERKVAEDGTVSFELGEEQYNSAMQTVNIASEYYDSEESLVWPEGNETFDKMIYVLDGGYTTNDFNGKMNFTGEWYYYYGDGKYGMDIEKAVVQDTFGGDTTDEPKNDPDQTPTTTPDDQQNTTVAPQPATDATSSTGDTATNNNNSNGAIQTGDASMAVIMLLTVAGAAGVAVFARKRFFG